MLRHRVSAEESRYNDAAPALQENARTTTCVHPSSAEDSALESCAELNVHLSKAKRFVKTEGLNSK